VEAVPLSHILYTGPFEALETEFLRHLGLLQEGDVLRPIDVLAGSNLLAVYLRRLAADRRGAIANVRFLTFVDLARQVVPGSDPRPDLPELGAALLARRALLETPEAAQFGPLRERPSLAAALVRTADDLRDARVPASVLRSPTSLAAAPDRRAFLDAVGASIEKLESFRSAFSDATSLLERAAGGALTPHPAPLLVYGLYDLGGIRETLLSRVALSRPVIAFVPEGADPSNPPPARASGPPVRGDLFRRLLGVPPTPLAADPGGPEVLTVLAPTENVEAREVVRELLRGVADGIPLHRMAVIVRDPPRQEPAIAAELRLRNLPFFRPAGPGTSRSPEGLAIRALFALAADDVPRAALEELFSLLDGLGMTSSAGPYRPARLVTALGSLRFTRGREALERKLEAARERLSAPLHAADDPDGRAVRRRRRETEALEELSAAVDTVLAALPETSDAPWTAWGERIARAADLLFGNAPGRKLLAAAAVAAVDAITSLGTVEAGTKTIGDVVALLPDALDTEPARQGRFERDGIALLSAVSARGLRFDLVVVPGLVEQTFPKRGLPDPLLFDSERAAIAEKTRCSLAPRSGLRHAREERFLFEITAASARTRLVLLATERDASADRPRVLSPYLLDHLSSIASTAFTTSTPRHAVSEKKLRQRALQGQGVRRVLLGRVEPAGPALDGSEALLRALQDSPGLSTRLTHAEALERALSRRAARLKGTFTAHEGRLGRRPSLSSLAGRVVSASRLEQLATCAYRVFFAHVLRLAPREEMAAGLPVLDPMTRGSLAHEALRMLARDLIAHGRSFGNLTEVDARSRARQLAETASRSWADAIGEEVAPVFVSLAARELETLVNAVLDFERARPDGPPVAGAEIRFGPVPSGADTEGDDALSTPEPVEYASAGTTWRLSGQIDRLDRSAIDDALRVIDYKFARPRPYSRKRPDLLVVGGERLQLPVYALAARRLGGEEVSSEYLFVGRDDRTGKTRVTPVAFTSEQTREAVASLGRFLDLAGQVFETGDFVPKTRSSFDGEESCRYCDFRTICGPGHTAVFERKRATEPATSPTRLFEELR
jgi:RecB family exonuclease